MINKEKVLKNIKEELKKYNFENLRLRDLQKLFQKEFDNEMALLNQSKNKRKKIFNELIVSYCEEISDKLKKLIKEEYNLIDSLNEEEIELFFNKKNLLVKIFKKELKVGKEVSSFRVYLDKEKRQEESKDMINDYLENFYLNHPIRRKKRKFIFHVGPTNSGKSYGALKEFEQANNACYLAPLRLLAWEVYDKFKNKLAISLITGEEKNIKENGTHTSSTIEMTNYNEEYEIGIIDEIQMLADEQRGGSWTKALLLLNAKRIYLCGDESVLNLLKKILKVTGDELEVVYHKRKAPLNLINKPISLNNLEKGDALIVFSRKNIYYYKELLEKDYNKKVSVVYGMLSPEVRKEEAERFVNGDTDILIATDAIGMGLNLPIKRVIFSTIEKYYNKQTYILNNSEIKQISGRAGRYGLHEDGLFGLLDQIYNPRNKYKKNLSEELIRSENRSFLDILKRTLISKVSEQNYAVLGTDFENFELINDKLIKNNYQKLSLLEFYYFFNELKYKNDFFIKANIDDQIEQTEYLNSYINILEIDNEKDLFKFSLAPVILRNEDNLDYLQDLYVNYFNQEGIEFDTYGLDMIDDLRLLEITYKNLDLYKWLKNQLEFNSFFISNEESLSNIKESLNRQIINKLKE